MNWMTIRSAAAHLKKENELSMISESTIRTLVRCSFPCVRIGNRTLINVDTFYEDLIQHSNQESGLRVYDNTSLRSEVAIA